VKIVDARSGKELVLGDEVKYPDLWSCFDRRHRPNPDSYRLMSVIVGLFSADVTIRRIGGEVVTIRGTVRYMHPKYLFQRVVFVET
jgi:hypothetical protein